MKFLDQMKMNVGDECYFVTVPLDKPHVCIRMRGQVVNKEAIRETLYYHILPLEVIEKRDNIIEFMHGSKFQTAKLDTGHGIKKRVNCFDVLINEPENFNEVLYERMSMNPFRVNSIDTKATLKEINELKLELLTEYAKIFHNGLEDIDKMAKDLKKKK